MFLYKNTMEHITFNKPHIDNLNFDNVFQEIVIEEDKTEFFGITGKEHYRLLSYISTLFNNCNIIDIGSHRGNSALALSYNKTNTILSFDIVDKIRSNIKNVKNITFLNDNLFENEGREKWKDTILSTPFIFMDVDPHNGNMELDMYNYLKSINYKGFVICDDVWYFKEMRDNFWHKINYAERFDITEFGHWSGTAIINFNNNITFEKNNNDNWTLVTAYFNLTKCYDASEEINKRDSNYYFHHSISTLSLPYNLVIYCDEDSLNLIQKIRPEYLKEKTEYIICNFDDFKFTKNGTKLEENFNDYRKKIIKNRNENPYNFDNRNTASYYLFCMSRYSMLKETIKRNTFNSTHFAWINFCIERMGYSNLIKLDEALHVNRDKFSTCYIDYIPEELIKNTNEYFRWGRCSMCSGFFTGNSEYMYKVCDLIENKFLEYLNLGYGHADEQLYSPVYFENPDLFDHYYGDYNQMITNYVYIYENPEAPIHNFITNSYNNKNYKKCYDACKCIWKSYCLNKCNINDQYIHAVYYYFMNCRKKLGIYLTINHNKYNINPNVTNCLLDNNSDLFKVYKFDNKIRLGPGIDGGYVIGHLDVNYDCYISAGISDNYDFTLEFMQKYNIPKEKIFCFDGTIENMPLNLQDKVIFYKKNISSTNSDITSNLTHYCRAYDKIFLKMDIEGSEWEWLSFMDETKLNKFVEIVIEFHGLANTSYNNNCTMHHFNCSYIQKLRCLEKLNKTHYLIHAHGNNWDMVSQNGLPNVMELVYINKNQFVGLPELNQEILPIKGLDFPNNRYCPDIDLNFYPFVNNIKKSILDGKCNPFLIDIPDKNEYTTEDYINIQEQLNKKNIDTILENLYDTLINKKHALDGLKTRIYRGIRQVIIDPTNDLLPMKNLYKIGNGGDKRNCFVSCTPFITNGNQKNGRFIASQQIVKSLQEVGFNGYFYLLNGGFPNPTGIEMKYVGVPYCFKIFMMLEAHKMGFENIIWIDSGCYALNNPQHLFDILQEDKLLYTKNVNHDYDEMIFPEILQLINKITSNDIHNAKFIQTIVFGLNFESDIIKKIVKEYYEMVDLGWPFFSVFPEECVLTALINKPEYSILFKNDDNPEKYKVQIYEGNLDENNARNYGFYFHHRNYSRYE